jgi:uncharacterized protein DUF4154
MIGRGCLVTALLGACALLGWRGTARAQEAGTDKEYQVKAAYLYNFGLYVEWPKELAGGIQGKFVIGVLGNDAIVGHLKKIAAAKKVRDLTIEVRHFKAADKCEVCHMLFIAATPDGEKKEGPEERLSGALKHVKGKGVLIVGESEGFAEKGGCINFYIDDNKVKFEINQEAAKEERLQVSSRLLRLGKLVSRAEK